MRRYVLFAVGVCAVAISAELSSIDDYIKRCDELGRARKHSEALRVVEEGLKHFPQDRKTPDLIMRRADCLSALGNWEESARAYLEFARKFPKHGWAPMALRRAGGVYIRAKLNKKAVLVFKKLRSLYPKHGESASSYIDEARIYQKQNDFDKALELLLKVGEQYRDMRQSAEALLEAGHICGLKLKDYPRAEELYRKVIERYQDERKYGDKGWWARLSLARLVRDTKGFDSAIPLFKEALKGEFRFHPQRMALMEFARSYARNKRYEEAITVYDVVLDKYPNIPQKAEILRDRGNWYLALGKEKEAEEAYLEALGSNPPPHIGVACAWSLGHLYQRHKRWEKTAEMFRLILEKYPDSGPGRVLKRDPSRIGSLYERAGNARRAYEAYTEAGLRRLAESLKPLLDRLSIASVSAHNAYLPERPFFRVNLSNTYGVAKEVKAEYTIWRVGEGERLVTKETRLVRLQPASVEEITVEVPSKVPGRYLMEFSALGEEREAVADLAKPFVSPLYVIRKGLLGKRKKSVERFEWERVAFFEAEEGTLYSGNVVREGGFVRLKLSGMVSEGDYVEFRFEVKEPVSVALRAVTSGRGRVSLSVDGKTGERHSLGQGIHILRAMLEGEVELDKVEVELWSRAERPGKLRVLRTHNVRRKKLRGEKVWSAIGEDAWVEFLVPSKRDAWYNLRLYGEFNWELLPCLPADVESQAGRGPSVDDRAIYLGLLSLYKVEVHGGVLGVRIGVGKTRANYKPVMAIWRRSYERGQVGSRVPEGFYAISFLFPLRLPKGNSRLRLHIPDRHSIHSVEVTPELEDIEVGAKIENEGNLYLPGEAVRFTIAVRNKSSQRRKIGGKCLLELLRLADSFRERRFPHFRFKNYPSEALEVLDIPEKEIKPGETVEFPLEYKPQKMGCVGVVVRLTDGERVYERHLTNFAVVFPVEDEFKYDSPFMANSMWSKRDTWMLPLFKKVGMNWIRTEITWSAFEREEGKFDWGWLDEFFNLSRKHKLYVMNLTEGCPEWAKLKLEDFVRVPYKGYTIVTDWAPPPNHLDDWEKAWREFAKRYKDICRAYNMWNEPWEGGGISGWKSTGEHYRNLYERVYRAVKSVAPSILMVAADSTHNTEWKLITAGMADKLDVISIHYEQLSGSYSFATARALKKKVWETETWLTPEGDILAVRRALVMIASGCEKVSYWHHNHLFEREGRYPTPTVAATSALCHFLEDTKFVKQVNPQCLPFIFLFAGKEKAVASILTNIGDGEIWGQLGKLPGARIEIPDPDSAFKAYDILGNPTGFRESGRLIVPISIEAVYIVTTVARLNEFENALAEARVTGIEPCEVVFYDFSQPLENLPPLRVRIRNALNVVVSGRLEVFAPDWLKLRVPKREFVNLAPGEAQVLEFPLAEAKLYPLNSYPVRVRITANNLTYNRSEAISVATIRKGTPVVDGKLDEWEKLGAVSVYLARARKSLETMQLWYPWEKWRKEHPEEFSAKVAFLWDDSFLYFSAEVNDPTEDVVPSLLSGKNLHKFQLPPADYVYVQAGAGITGSGADAFMLSVGNVDRKKWFRKYELYPPGHPLYRMNPFISTPYQYSIYPTEEGSEIMRLRTPEFYWAHPLPLNYKWMRENCRVEGAKVVVRRIERGWIYECAVPWSELKEIKHAPGETIRLSFKVNERSPGKYLCWSAGRSIAKLNSLDFEPSWWIFWSAETEWGFTGKGRR